MKLKYFLPPFSLVLLLGACYAPGTNNRLDKLESDVNALGSHVTTLSRKSDISTPALSTPTPEAAPVPEPGDSSDVTKVLQRDQELAKTVKDLADRIVAAQGGDATITDIRQAVDVLSGAIGDHCEMLAKQIAEAEERAHIAEAERDSAQGKLKKQKHDLAECVKLLKESRK